MDIRFKAQVYAKKRKVYEIYQKGLYVDLNAKSAPLVCPPYSTRIWGIETKPKNNFQDDLCIRTDYFLDAGRQQSRGFNIEGYDQNMKKCRIEHRIESSGLLFGGELIAPITGHLKISAIPNRQSKGRNVRLDLKKIIAFLDEKYGIKDGLSSRLIMAEINGVFPDNVSRAYERFCKKPSDIHAAKLNALLNENKKKTVLYKVDIKWKEKQDIMKLLFNPY